MPNKLPGDLDIPSDMQKLKIQQKPNQLFVYRKNTGHTFAVAIRAKYKARQKTYAFTFKIIQITSN